MERRQPSAQDADRIRSGFDAIEPGADVMRETGKLLSDLTGTAAVVVSPHTESLSLKHLRFIRTKPDELLAVLVMSNGSVQNRFLTGRATEADLQRIHNVMDDVTEGRTLGELRDLFARRLASERVQHDDLRRQAFQLGEAAVTEAAFRAANIVIEGQAKLLEQPEFSDAAGVKQVVTALDERRAPRGAARRDDGGQGDDGGRGERGGGARRRPALDRRRDLLRSRARGGDGRRHRPDTDGLPEGGAARDGDGAGDERVHRPVERPGRVAAGRGRRLSQGDLFAVPRDESQ